MVKQILRKLRPKYEITDVVFRGLFSLIFIGLGFEHLFADEIIQSMMPEWLPFKRLPSIMAGLVLLAGGASVMFGFKTRQGALLLGTFLVVVTLSVHAPAMTAIPQDLHTDWHWLWDVYQRSNFVKNLCLLGVCFHLINHKLGKYSLDVWLRDKRSL